MSVPPCCRYSRTDSRNGPDIGEAASPSPIWVSIDGDTIRIGLAYELLTPRQVCAAFARGLKRPCSYKRGPVTVEVPIPNGYRAQLEGIEVLFGEHEAPYFGPDGKAPEEALELWEGYRGMEEYAREVFPLEEAANGLMWMH